jgi:hypothetical protein
MAAGAFSTIPAGQIATFPNAIQSHYQAVQRTYSISVQSVELR